MNDISLYESGNGGDLVLVNDDFQLVSGLFNNVYLCLFGGNIQGSTTDAVLVGEERKDWWGNKLLNSTNTDVQFNSTFENLLNTTALTSAGVSVLENAAKKDLQPLQEIGAIDVNILLTGADSLEMQIKITEKETNISQEFLLIWNETRDEITLNKVI